MLISFFQAWPKTLFYFRTTSKLFLHRLPSHFVPLTAMRSFCCPCYIYSPIIYIYIYPCSYNILFPATFPKKRDLWSACYVSTLSNPEYFRGAWYPSLSLLERWEMSFLVAYGKQESHSSLELFLTGLFSVPDRECCNLQFVVYFFC